MSTSGLQPSKCSSSNESSDDDLMPSIALAIPLAQQASSRAMPRVQHYSRRCPECSTTQGDAQNSLGRCPECSTIQGDAQTHVRQDFKGQVSRSRQVDSKEDCQKTVVPNRWIEATSLPDGSRYLRLGPCDRLQG